MLISEFSFPQKEEPICEGVSAGESINWAVGGNYYVCYLLIG